MMTTIRVLPPTLINQIAAGEVVERPAAVLKELLENALDAGATSIDIYIREGGKSYLSVVDNGSGMTREELDLAVERHATSKLPEEDLWAIRTYGFRGEALPSMGSVARLTISSRHKDSDEAWSLTVEGGQKGSLKPSSQPKGTKVEVKDLFFATPARLKFLKSTAQETRSLTEIIERLALKHTEVAFRYYIEGKEVLALEPHSFNDRLKALMGDDFASNHLPFNVQRDAYQSQGVLSLPTLHKNTSIYQHLYVNGRYVKEKLFHQCLKIAYQDLMPGDRFPMAVVFLEVPRLDLDVNVHPAKTEVRFRDSAFLRNFFLTLFKDTLKNVNFRTTDTLRQQALEQAKPFLEPFVKAVPITPQGLSRVKPPPLLREDALSDFKDKQEKEPRVTGITCEPLSLGESNTLPSFSFEGGALEEESFPSASFSPPASTYVYKAEEPFKTPPLGYAKAQLLGTYIIAENNEGLVIIDQHAVHERVIYEQYKKDMAANHLKRQVLLVPEIINLKPALAEALEPRLEGLIKMGLLIETFGRHSFLVREVPHGCTHLNWSQLVEDMAHESAGGADPQSLEIKLLRQFSSAACHGSIRAGQKLTIEEMNGLLRQMETTPFAGQCNHGRPTYVVLKKQDLEKLFHRS